MSRQPRAPTRFEEIVRRADPDRFLCALFAPSARREAVLLLAAVNHELARAREVASLAPLALIRLHWWREVAATRAEGGARRAHEVAGPLGEAIDAGVIDPADIRAMVDAREAEAADDIPDLAAWESLVRGTAGRLAIAQARVLGADAAQMALAGERGAAYGAVGQLRNIEALARRERCLLPADLLAAVGLTPEDVAANPRDPRLLPVRARLAEWARARPGGRLPRSMVAAGLVGVLARRDLRRLDQPPRPRGVGDRVAVLAAALLGRV